jgi:predicted RNase H-like HicB family nuclease
MRALKERASLDLGVRTRRESGKKTANSTIRSASAVAIQLIFQRLGSEGGIMNYYVSICVPLASGRWRASFPDVAGCDAEADSLEEAIEQAAGALTQYAVALNGEKPGIPLPRDLSEIRSDDYWTSTHGVDWSAAVVTMIPLRL